MDILLRSLTSLPLTHGKNHVVLVKIVLVELLLSKGNDGEEKLYQIRH
jgi:hypothetical protein